ncbi:hypothetical protein MXB_1186, partial [Myxobolus squamalis]
GVPANTSGAVVLGLLAAFQIGIYVVDTFVLKKAMINTLVVYPVFLLGLISIITYTGVGFFASAGEITGLVIFNILLAIVLFGLKVFAAIKHKRCSSSSMSQCKNKA